MSSNENYNITTDNFQELCLLYVDGELTTGQGEALVAFAAHHPGLQELLGSLQATKLDIPYLPFENKESLLSFHMDSVSDEALLLYLDNELSNGEAEKVKSRLKGDFQYQQVFKRLEAARLDRNEAIAFPFKAALYRRTEATVRPISFLRIAIAVVLLLAGAIFWFTSQDAADTTPLGVMERPEDSGQPAGSKALPVPQNRIAGKEVKVTDGLPDVVKEKSPFQRLNGQQPLAKRTREKMGSLRAPAPTREKFSPRPEEKVNIASVTDRGNSPVPYKDKSDPIANPTQHTLNNVPVTTPSVPAYTIADAAAPTDSGVNYAASFTSNEKKGSVRGFLRKATRFIERRTGINPVNDDDQLLIGVVAIKL